MTDIENEWALRKSGLWEFVSKRMQKIPTSQRPDAANYFECIEVGCKLAQQLGLVKGTVIKVMDGITVSRWRWTKDEAETVKALATAICLYFEGKPYQSR